MKKFKEINQSETAKRKIKSLAKNSNLDVELVKLLANYCWDFDPIGKEATGWVKNEQIDLDKLNEDLETLRKQIDFPDISALTQDDFIKEILHHYQQKNPNTLREKFLIGGVGKNYAYLSEYATYHYINNLSEEKLRLLDCKKTYSFRDFLKNLFLKLFRGGAIDRYDLFYVYCDMCIELPYLKKETKAPNNWIVDLLNKIANLDKSATLNDLLKCCQNTIKGDKYFKKEVLQALSYSGDLKIKGIDVATIFIPEFRDVLSPHFYTNEWTYPLRFWNKNKD